MAAKKQGEHMQKPTHHPDGHYLIEGARWHYPKTGEPSVCAVKGCERVLTRHLRGNVVDEMEAADDQEDTAAPADAAAADPLAAAG